MERISSLTATQATGGGAKKIALETEKLGHKSLNKKTEN